MAGRLHSRETMTSRHHARQRLRRASKQNAVSVKLQPRILNMQKCPFQSVV
jgi:hypothetical protein